MDAILVATDRTHRIAAGDKENVPGLFAKD